MKIGVISDTHIPLRARTLPPEVFDIFRDVDLILHAGDLVTPAVLDELEALSPVQAVHGNVDPPELRRRLPACRRIRAGRFTIGLAHGHEGKGSTTPERAASHFSGVDAVVFGHSHVPLNEFRNGRLLFNPGSPTDRRAGTPYLSVGLLEVGETLAGRIVPLGAPHRP